MNDRHKQAVKPAKPKAGAHSHRVRIIGGQWKRTPLVVLDADGLRPTPDRVRETIFNWLNHLLDGAWGKVSCLDLFAGSGALGFEAASRGAERVVMVESNGAAVRQLQATQEKLQATQVAIVRGDAGAVAQGLLAKAGNAPADAGRFQVIFLDPPYHQAWLAKILPICEKLLADGGLLYVEAEQALNADVLPDWMQGWEAIRAEKAGVVHYHLLRRTKTT